MNDVLGVGDAGAFGNRSRRASSRRLAKKVDSPIPRAAQKAVTDWPDSFQATTVSLQNWFPWRRRLVSGTGSVSSWVRTAQSYQTPQGVPGPDAYENEIDNGHGRALGNTVEERCLHGEHRVLRRFGVREGVYGVRSRSASPRTAFDQLPWWVG